MATYRVINPAGDVTDTRDIESADEAHAWFVDARADNSELGWRNASVSNSGNRVRCYACSIMACSSARRSWKGTSTPS